MQILRVEHRVTHEGPYVSGVRRKYGWEHDTQSGYPAPQNDVEIASAWRNLINKSEWCTSCCYNGHLATRKYTDD